MKAKTLRQQVLELTQLNEAMRQSVDDKHLEVQHQKQMKDLMQKQLDRFYKLIDLL